MMDKTIFGLGCFPRIEINQKTLKELEEELTKAIEALKEKVAEAEEKEGEKQEETEDNDSDTRIYNVIYDGELYYVKGDRFEYSDDGFILSVFMGDEKVAVFPDFPAIIDDSCYYGMGKAE